MNSAHALKLVLLFNIIQGFAEGADLQVTGLNFSNHSINATATTLNTTTSPNTTEATNTTKTPTTTTTTTDQKNVDNSFRSEVYKMHANGLMLLHAQRTRSGIEAKKSSLNDKLATSGGINYHTRSKKTNETVTANAVQDNERHMEAKLGDLPQVRQRRRDVPQVRERRTTINNVSNSASCENSSNSTCAGQKKKQIDKKPQHHHHHHHHHHHNQEHHHKHHHHHHHHHKHQWRSIVQGEDAFGEEVKKTRVYPEKFKKATSNEETKQGNDVRSLPTVSVKETTDVKHLSENDYFNANKVINVNADAGDVNAKVASIIEASGQQRDDFVARQQIVKPMGTNPDAKRARLKRALDLMGAGEFGVDDNPLYDSQQGVSQTEGDREAGDLRTRFFSDQQDREDIPFIPKIDDAFDIPKIPPISLLKENDDEDDDMITDVGKRRTSVSQDDGNDGDEGDWNDVGGIRAITSPTPIPEMTAPSTIGSIADITEIPTLRSVPSSDKTSQKKAEGKEESSSPYFHKEINGNTTIVRA